MHGTTDGTTDGTRRFGRRSLIAGAGAAAAVKALPTAPTSAAAAGPSPSGIPKGTAPKPIPGGIDTGDPNVGFIHWWLPGPDTASTPVLGLPGFGLDADPSTITDFEGVSAMAVVAGSVRGSDGVDYDCEFDLRAMKGKFIDADGNKRNGAFAFL